MLEIYLGNNKRRNKALLESLEKYGVFYLHCASQRFVV